MPVTPEEARLHALEAKITRGLRDLKDLRDDLAAIRQSIREERMWIQAFVGSIQQADDGFRYVRLPSGGIAAGSSGTVEFYEDGSFATLTGESADGYNDWADGLNPASRKGRVHWNKKRNRWQVDLWSCS